MDLFVFVVGIIAGLFCAGFAVYEMSKPEPGFAWVAILLTLGIGAFVVSVGAA